MKKAMGMLIILALLTAPTLGFAEKAASPWVQETTYSGKVVGKFNYGFKNLLLGWTQIFYQPYKAQKDGTDQWKALGKGLFWDFPVDTVLGAAHAATFLIPVDIPIPDGGVNLSE